MDRPDRLDRLSIEQRVVVKELNVSGWIYESAMPESGTTEADRIYGVNLDEVAFPKNFVATKVWHCRLDALEIIEQRLDDKELREQIETILENYHYETANEPFVSDYSEGERQNAADQIQALFDEARKEDREKIAEKLGYILYCDYGLHLSNDESLELADQFLALLDEARKGER